MSHPYAMYARLSGVTRLSGRNYQSSSLSRPRLPALTSLPLGLRALFLHCGQPASAPHCLALVCPPPHQHTSTYLRIRYYPNKLFLPFERSVGNRQDLKLDGYCERKGQNPSGRRAPLGLGCGP